MSNLGRLVKGFLSGTNVIACAIVWQTMVNLHKVTSESLLPILSRSH